MLLRPLLTSLLLLLFCSGCAAEESRAEPWAEVGIFFGGQVQRVKRAVVPADGRLTFGFRVHFPEGSVKEVRGKEVHYEVVRPGPMSDDCPMLLLTQDQ